MQHLGLVLLSLGSSHAQLVQLPPLVNVGAGVSASLGSQLNLGLSAGVDLLPNGSKFDSQD